MGIQFGLMVFLLSGAALATQPPGPQVDVLEVGKDAYRLTLRLAGTAEVSVGQQALMPTAQWLCGDLTVVLGRYEFESIQPVSPEDETKLPALVLTQEIACVTPGTAAEAGPASSPGTEWRQTEAEEAAAVEVFQAFLAAKDRGDYAKSYGMLSLSMQNISPFDVWQEAPKRFNALAGSLVSREIRRITWYRDPPSAPVPGVYVAIDFAGAFANVELQCGYIMLFQVSATGFEVIREEMGYLDKETAKQISDVQRQELEGQLRCVPKQ